MKTHSNNTSQKELRRRIRMRRKEGVDKAFRKLSSRAAMAWNLQYQRFLVLREIKFLKSYAGELGLNTPKPMLTSWILGCLVIVAALLLDYFLFATAAHYIVERTYSATWFVSLAVIGVPIAIVILELHISTRLMLAKQALSMWEDTVRSSDKRDLRMWKFVATLSILVINGLVIATFLVELDAKEGALDLVSGMLLVALVCLTCLCHISILLGGKHAYEAREYLYIRFKGWRLEKKLKRKSKRYAKQAHMAAQEYLMYIYLLTSYNEWYPENPIAEGFYDNPTRSILQSYFGNDMFTSPNQNGTVTFEDQNHEEQASPDITDDFQKSDMQGSEDQQARTTPAGDRSPRASIRFHRRPSHKKLIEILKRLRNNPSENPK